MSLHSQVLYFCCQMDLPSCFLAGLQWLACCLRLSLFWIIFVMMKWVLTSCIAHILEFAQETCSKLKNHVMFLNWWWFNWSPWYHRLSAYISFFIVFSTAWSTELMQKETHSLVGLQSLPVESTYSTQDVHQPSWPCLNSKLVNTVDGLL